MAKTFLYFGYGSNLLQRRIHIQNPSAVRAGIGKIKVSARNFPSLHLLFYIGILFRTIAWISTDTQIGGREHQPQSCHMKVTVCGVLYGKLAMNT